MTKLEKLKALAEARTAKEKWFSGNLNVYLGESDEVVEVLYGAESGPHTSETNNDFIAEIANSIDALLAVVDAAKDRASEGHDSNCPVQYVKERMCKCGHKELVEAIDALEKS